MIRSCTCCSPGRTTNRTLLGQILIFRNPKSHTVSFFKSCPACKREDFHGFMGASSSPCGCLWSSSSHPQKRALYFSRTKKSLKHWSQATRQLKTWIHIFKLFYVCLSLKKLVNEKYFSVKKKFGLVFRKVFSFYFERKTFSGSCKKFRNIIWFADYIKFGLQTSDCYIYFVLNICFSISSLRI